jgi:hypothetical protein
MACQLRHAAERAAIVSSVGEVPPHFSGPRKADFIALAFLCGNPAAAFCHLFTCHSRNPFSVLVDWL